MVGETDEDDGPASDGIEAVVFDVDGTLLRGGEPIPGAREALERVREAGLSVLFVPNDPVDPPEAYARRIREAGLSADPSGVPAGDPRRGDFGTVTPAQWATIRNTRKRAPFRM